MTSIKNEINTPWFMTENQFEKACALVDLMVELNANYKVPVAAAARRSYELLMEAGNVKPQRIIRFYVKFEEEVNFVRRTIERQFGEKDTKEIDLKWRLFYQSCFIG